MHKICKPAIHAMLRCISSQHVRIWSFKDVSYKVYEIVKKAVFRFAIHSATAMHAKAQRKEKLQALRDKCEAELGTSVPKLHDCGCVRKPTCGCVPWIGCELLHSLSAKCLRPASYAHNKFQTLAHHIIHTHITK